MSGAGLLDFLAINGQSENRLSYDFNDLWNFLDYNLRPTVECSTFILWVFFQGSKSLARMVWIGQLQY